MEHERAAIHWHLIRLTPGRSHSTMLDWFSIGRKLYSGVQQVDGYCRVCCELVCVCTLQIDPLMKCLFVPPGVVRRMPWIFKCHCGWCPSMVVTTDTQHWPLTQNSRASSFPVSCVMFEVHGGIQARWYTLRTIWNIFISTYKYFLYKLWPCLSRKPFLKVWKYSCLPGCFIQFYDFKQQLFYRLKKSIPQNTTFYKSK